VPGVWLGDGTGDCAGITSVDEPMLQEIAAAGHVLTPWSTAERTAPRYGISSLQRPLRQLSLLHNKRLPAIYQRTSLVQRLAFLQGLMDTYGFCDARQGTCEFSSTSDILPACYRSNSISDPEKVRFTQSISQSTTQNQLE
jgi:hypothetical protein